MTTNNSLQDLHRDYESADIDIGDLDANPVKQFAVWLEAAMDNNIVDANAMSLATANRNMEPSVRIVLLKQFDEHGFCWYTDSRSQKGQELADNPNAALLFFWREQNRQVRISGRVERLSSQNADDYFYSRPEGSRFSAAASRQTSVIDDRTVLQDNIRALRAKHPDGDVPRPDAWIGYRLQPGIFEFWQGKVNRLHDRLRYTREGGQWSIRRLSP